MDNEYEWQCDCGAMKGVLSLGAAGINRVVCYCNDCQAFAHYLDRVSDVLDDAGGTDIAQMSAARVTINEGVDQLHCMRLSESGIHRWYAGCCRTPIGNTGGYGMPFCGVIHGRLVAKADADGVLGPVSAQVQTASAKGEIDGLGGFPLGSIWRFLRIIVGAKLSGAQARAPFFDTASKEPVVTPVVLDESERSALMAKVAAA